MSFFGQSLIMPTLAAYIKILLFRLPAQATIVRSQGSHLYDRQGNSYLDSVSGVSHGKLEGIKVKNRLNVSNQICFPYRD